MTHVHLMGLADARPLIGEERTMWRLLKWPLLIGAFAFPVVAIFVVVRTM